MLDSLLLLLVGLICAVLAWAFWHFAGWELILLFMLLPTLVVIVDNYKLRKELKSGKETKESAQDSSASH
ncbi:MAG TPA: hypothetical protein VFF16_10470 [Telluria sp.]|nr:hypothetical protein [Telluria sp.]